MTGLESYVKIGEGVHFQELDGEAVIFNSRTGTYFGLNAEGTRIWNLLIEHGDANKVFRILTEEYDVTPERLKADLTKLIQQLQTKELLMIHQK